MLTVRLLLGFSFKSFISLSFSGCHIYLKAFYKLRPNDLFSLDDLYLIFNVSSE